MRSRASVAAPDTDRLRAWSHARQHLGHGAPGAGEALAGVIAVYSAHPSAPLALWARIRAMTAGAFTILESNRLAVRVVAMRGSAFLVPVDDADRIVAATRQPVPDSYLRGRGLDRASYEALKPRILEALREPSTPSDLRAALGAHAAGADPYFAMRAMARDGLVVRVGTGRLRTDDLRWVATDAWLGRPFLSLDPAETQEQLATAYLRAFGPARAEDFAWWAGITRSQARVAFASAAIVDVAAGHFLPVDLQGAWDSGAPLHLERVDVLPKWDPYTMGFAPDGRRRLVDDADLAKAYSTRETRVGATSGDGLPLVLRGGAAVAVWSQRLDGERMHITLRPFSSSEAASRRLLRDAEPEFGSLAELLSAKAAVSLER